MAKVANGELKEVKDDLQIAKIIFLIWKSGEKCTIIEITWK